ncbi:MAG: glycosyltransferase family 9 protein [Bacteroidales bacterium]|nr:glycosyltransferase family 9 protein [Bacteroidales bacterium]
MIHKLLVIRFSALGDIAMTVPSVVSVCINHPEIEVTMLTSKMGEKIYRAVTSNVPNLHVRGINPHNDYPGIVGLNRLYKELQNENFDAVADLHDVLRTQWLRFRFGISGKMRKHINKGRKEKKALVAHKSNVQLKSGVVRYQEVFEKLGLNAQLSYDVAEVRKNMFYDVKGSHSVAIAPFAQHKGKIYPKEKMLEVIDLLLKENADRHIYLLGGPNEQAELDIWAERCPERIHNTAGRQFFAEDMALMAHLDCVVSMDSANMHLASLVGTRVVSVWGATHIFAGFLGFGQKEEDVVQLSLPCRPCSVYGNKPCKFGDYRCLSGIEPQQIVNRIIG